MLRGDFDTTSRRYGEVNTTGFGPVSVGLQLVELLFMIPSAIIVCCGEQNWAVWNHSQICSCFGEEQAVSGNTQPNNLWQKK